MRYWIANKFRNMASRIEPVHLLEDEDIWISAWAEMHGDMWGASEIDKEGQEAKSKAMRDKLKGHEVTGVWIDECRASCASTLLTIEDILDDEVCEECGQTIGS